MPNSIPEKPWTYILTDFITKLPLAQGYDLILVVVDRLMKMVHFILTVRGYPRDMLSSVSTVPI